MATHPDATPNLNAALAKAQGQMDLAVMGATAQVGGGTDKDTGQKRAVRSYMYANLASAIDSSREALAANGLAVMQEVETNETSVTVATILLHSSGEQRTQRMTLPVTARTAQAFGSAITYARRYAFCALLNIAGEADDDGASASTSMLPNSSVTHQQREVSDAADVAAADSERRAGIQKLVGAFLAIGWTEAAIDMHVGHSVWTITNDEWAALRKTYAGEKGKLPDPDELARLEVQRKAEEALAKEPVNAPLTFAAYVDRLRAATTKGNVALIVAEAAGANMPPGDLKALHRVATDRTFILDDAENQKTRKLVIEDRSSDVTQ